jgi:hypothetical protein
MPKVFYTEIDIEELFRRGIRSLEVNDNVVLTDLAYEKANRLGLKLISAGAANPPAAPVRPYVSQPARQSPPPASAPAASAPHAASGGTGAASSDSPAGLHDRIRSAVIARLGSQVDLVLLDNIIRRVLHSTGVK